VAYIYSVTMKNQTIVADESLVCIRTATAGTSRASMIQILRCWASQVGTDTSDQIGVLIGLKASAFGTFTSTTPSPHFISGPASGITGSTSVAAASAGTDASAEGAGTVTSIIDDSFNNLNGYLWVPTPEERIIVPFDTAIVLKIVGTPTSLTGWSAGITYLELN
jgi:hypothetical protein